jgi:SAM-dependent methyltransferase
VVAGPHPARQPIYDVIGRTYAGYRRPEPSIVALIDRALGDAHTVVDVGSGTGSYGPAGRSVVAVEPSGVMIAQRPPGAAPVVQALADALPLPSASFDAAISVFSVHHWDDPAGGLAELRRVAAAAVVLTWDPTVQNDAFWLLSDYLPQVADLSVNATAVHEIADLLSPAEVWPVPVPADCRDGFFGAYWRRPWMYLDPGARASISALALLDPAEVEPAMERLSNDLDSGAWERRYGHLTGLDELDLGYRLVVRRPLPPASA